MSEIRENFENSQVLEFLKNLDSRVSRIEARLNIEVSQNEDYSEDAERIMNNFEEPDNFESKLGEYWFANLGILILAIGVVLLLTTPFVNIPAYVPSIWIFDRWASSLFFA